MNTEEFIKRAVSLHGDRFDYSESVYHYRRPVKIICKDHGAFYQRYDHHIHPKRSGGCAKCYASSLMLTESSAIGKLKSVHGELYDYSCTEYKGAREDISVQCRQHGLFTISYARHAAGQGCRQCAIGALFSTNEEFIRKAMIAHGGKYDYSKTIYKYSGENVCITCKEHGDFYKTPDNHIHKTNPQGCPKCKEYKCFDRDKKAFVYILVSECGGHAKVGVSNNPKKRFKVLKRLTPFVFYEYKVYEFETGREAEQVEKSIHESHQKSGFINFDGCTEWMILDEALKRKIDSI